jgi:hypothetical protein
VERHYKRRGRRNFLKSLETDDYIETAAYGLVVGMNPYEVLSQGKEDYLISIAIIQQALRLNNERKTEEIKVLSELTGMEVAKIIAKIF